MSFLSNVFTKAKQAVAGADNDPNFRSGIQFYTPGQPIFTPKNYQTFVRDGYKRNPTVYSCINKISGAAAGINWKLYTDRKMKTTIDRHPLLDLWQRPNPRVPGTGSFIEKVFGFWHIAGNSYIYAYRPNPTAEPLALWHLRPDQMKAVAGGNKVEDWVYGYGSQNPQIYDVADICHIVFPDYDDDIYGLSPLETASYFSDLQNEAMGWNISLMQNMGRPASVFFSKGILTPQQRNQIEQEIRKKYSGKRNAGRPLILEADMDWKNMSLTPAELDFLKSFELSTRQIAAVYDIAPELIGDSAGKTFANVAEARQALYLENVLPKLDRFVDYLNSWLVPMYADLSGAYFTYDKEDIEALQAVYEAQKKAKHDRARADWLAGGITLEEYCEIIGAEKPKFGAVRRIGAILVSEESMEDYADQSLTEPANPPMPVPEPLNVPGANPALPGSNPKQPALPAPKQPANPKPPKPAAPAKKFLDANGIYQPDDVNERLAQYHKDGVTHLRWVTDKFPCDICIQNEGHVVAVGDTFPSGHLLPQAHPNCGCEVIPYSFPGLGFQTANLQLERKQQLHKIALDLGIERMMELVERYKAERYKPHEEIGHMDTGEDGDTLQLRFMPVQAISQKAQTQNGTASTRLDKTRQLAAYRGVERPQTDQTTNDTTEEEEAARNVYRAFMEALT